MKHAFTTDVVIGMEVHVELKTHTKLFCSCPRPAVDGETPNSRVCPICLGHPGSKPMLNRACIDMGLKLAVALKCRIAPQLIFSRKSYFYPDMSKNYQITQYEEPLGTHGELKLSDGSTIHVSRIHLEEDPAALGHLGSYVLVDYNRSGNPLIEIVTAPQLESPERARDFMKRLVTLIEYLDIFDVESCIIKADANISIKESGYTRVEIKNVTGFKEIARALFYEVERQRSEVAQGKKLLQETRGWDAIKGLTYSMRTKETEEDYGYIIDPDLVPTTISQEWIGKIRNSMPELAEEKVQKFALRGVDLEMAKVISQDKDLAEFLDATILQGADAELAAKWVRKELVRALNQEKLKLGKSKATPQQVACLIKLLKSGEITDRVGQRLIEKIVSQDIDIQSYIEKEGLGIVSDTGHLEDLCKQVIAENPTAVQDFKQGEQKSFNFLVGKVMQKAKGRGDPAKINELMKLLVS
ncbi:Asp-tRNA(Asn)/Glu-tRNA(Gln) amidotransferase subunit GatB [Candidatus Woesearchaeota archaeon]|nr:Asp-tRNA(Asn)/Glu-tRNA(Gln) amidotransferase subunit GatB [Candidatus Woesearchaeota archaeon]